MTEFLPIPASPAATARITRALTAREAAEKLEATFLAEMLKSAGLGEQTSAFSGGIGEEQFASFHREALAERMVASGGIGLADRFYKAMMDATDD